MNQDDTAYPDSVEEALKKPNSFIFGWVYKNVSSATRYLRDRFGSNCRAKKVGVNYQVTVDGTTFVYASLKNAVENAVACVSPPKAFKKPPRRVSNKMLARQLDGKRGGALGPKGKALLELLELLELLRNDHA